jgi:tetratricopeptide (TPR) repeat protein
VASDPNFAAAWAGLAEAMSRPRANFPDDAPARATAAARRALALEPSNAQAHATLGFIHLFYDWDAKAAKGELATALRVDPNSARTHDWYAIALLVSGETRKAIEEAERAHALEPATLDIAADVVLTRYLARDYDGAARAAFAIPRTERQLTNAQSYLISTLMAERRFDEALSELTHGNAEPDEVIRDIIRYRAGRTDLRDRIVARLENPEVQRVHTSDGLAAAYAVLGEKEKAFQWLERAYRERSFGLIFAALAPEFDSIRDDARFVRLIRRVNVAG